MNCTANQKPKDLRKKRKKSRRGKVKKKTEKKSQKILRREYIEAVKGNLLAQLNNIDIEEKDGTVVNLGEKYGKKIGN